MPEGLEVELYRRAALRVEGRTITAVDVDASRSSPRLGPALLGRRVVGVERSGKVLQLRTDGPTLGVHFGMTGRLVVDGTAPIERLEYGSGRDDPAWDRLVIRFGDGGVLRVNDPRRWARFDLDPDVSRLGPDALSVTLGELTAALSGRLRPVKAVLLDQRAIAGLGNMCVDEVLWHAAVPPHRPAAELGRGEIRRLHGVVRRELPAMLDRGGSHTGTISPEIRALVPACPRDGRPLTKATLAGRSTVWCPHHQR